MSFDATFEVVGNIEAKLNPVQNIDAEFGTLYELGCDPSDTTAVAGDVKSGKKFHLADGSLATGSLLWNWLGDEAECIDDNIHSFSAALEDTDFASWTPSTIASIIVASSSKTARAINTADYNYLIRWFFDADIKFNSGTTMKAVPNRQTCEMVQAIIKRPSSYTALQTPTFTGNACVTLYTAPLFDYYSTGGTRTLAFSASYGFYIAAVAATFSSSTSDSPNLTIKTPTISARCYSTYFATARGADVDQANSTVSMRGELWRVKRGNAAEAMYNDAVNIYHNPL